MLIFIAKQTSIKENTQNHNEIKVYHFDVFVTNILQPFRSERPPRPEQPGKPPHTTLNQEGMTGITRTTRAGSKGGFIIFVK